VEIREELLKMGILDKKRTSPMKIRTSKEDISKLEKSGHFYFALTGVIQKVDSIIFFALGASFHNTQFFVCIF
jgi:hypothetical protein